MYPGICYSVPPVDPESQNGSLFTTSLGDFNFEIDEMHFGRLNVIRPGQKLLVSARVTSPPLGGRLLHRYEAFYVDGRVYGAAVVTDPDPSSPAAAKVREGDTVTVDVLRA